MTITDDLLLTVWHTLSIDRKKEALRHLRHLMIAERGHPVPEPPRHPQPAPSTSQGDTQRSGMLQVAPWTLSREDGPRCSMSRAEQLRPDALAQHARRDAWYKADRERLHRYAICEMTLYRTVIDANTNVVISRERAAKDLRGAIADQILTPACNRLGLQWKEQQLRVAREYNLLPIELSEIEAAIVADIAYLDSRPQRGGTRRKAAVEAGSFFTSERNETPAMVEPAVNEEPVTTAMAVAVVTRSPWSIGWQEAAE